MSRTSFHPLLQQFAQKPQLIHQQDFEGRILTIELDTCFLVNVYTPNVGRDVDEYQNM